eukprot:CAMPEP_0184531184 /NCGR_PEP_ID=MMETSP0198_2-20121128/13399_1 /TAXON_ID=1112570 /ORGANISM="Thraustochytrium sp., Strain LLF1b" /LENGTH=151 /DNA_ID=CAMNT_0026923499 /DNA_START=247 /DNA_END=699 /DNA_ORIENTATION=+
MVFDGGDLPMKGGTENSRRERRVTAKAEADKLYAAGKAKEAHDAYTRAVDVTPEMAFALIVELKKNNVSFVVAPYEADAQMAYLCKTGIANFALSEDSDCLPFGCGKVFFKLDGSGTGELIDMARLHECRTPNLAGFSEDMFLDMCILAGC